MECEDNGISLTHQNMDIASTIMEAVKSFSECTVCCETLIPPIHQCFNGHIFCNGCLTKLINCAECRVSLITFPKIRNIALEKIINNLRVGCPNKNDGCDATLTVEALGKHLQLCPFTPFNLCSKILGWKDCDRKVIESTAVDHLESDHLITKVDSSSFTLRLNFSEIPTGSNDFFFEPFLVASMETPVVVRTLVTGDGYFTFTGFALTNDEEDLQKIRLKFRIYSQPKRTSFEWTGCAQSYRSFKETQMTNSFRIPVASLIQFWGPLAVRDITEIAITVFVWENSHLTQEDKIDEEVHIFGQNISSKINPTAGQGLPSSESTASTIIAVDDNDDMQSTEDETGMSTQDWLSLDTSPWETGTDEL